MTNGKGVTLTIWPEALGLALAANLGKVQISVDDKMIASTIAQKIFEMVGNFDDAGCDWTTDAEGNFCIAGDPEWQISKNWNVGVLVDAMNIINHGHPLKAGEGESDGR
jgi:hypothetical protein